VFQVEKPLVCLSAWVTHARSDGRVELRTGELIVLLNPEPSFRERFKHDVEWPVKDTLKIITSATRNTCNQRLLASFLQRIDLINRLNPCVLLLTLQTDQSVEEAQKDPTSIYSEGVRLLHKHATNPDVLLAKEERQFVSDLGGDWSRRGGLVYYKDRPIVMAEKKETPHLERILRENTELDAQIAIERAALDKEAKEAELKRLREQRAKQRESACDES
jgi:uncharacterized protein YdcH (DUF465 family)